MQAPGQLGARRGNTEKGRWEVSLVSLQRARWEAGMVWDPGAAEMQSSPCDQMTKRLSVQHKVQLSSGQVSLSSVSVRNRASIPGLGGRD